LGGTFRVPKMPQSFQLARYSGIGFLPGDELRGLSTKARRAIVLLDAKGITIERKNTKCFDRAG
jgi:hypothetical protein